MKEILSAPVRVAVIGLGFMGATHIAAYAAARAVGVPCELVAVCDRKPSRRRGELWDVGGNAVSDMSARKLAFDPQRVRAYERDALLAEAEAALRSGSADRRRRALGVATAKGIEPMTRRRATLAAAAPGAAARQLARRENREGTSRISKWTAG